METSAKASINVEEAFFTLARDIKAKMEKRLVRFRDIYLDSSLAMDRFMVQMKKSFFLSFPFSPPHGQFAAGNGKFCAMVVVKC